MREMIEYIKDVGEDYRDFLCQTLKGQVEEEIIQKFTMLLEMVVTEINDSDYALSVIIKSQSVDVTVIHHGHTIKNRVIDIIEEQVDYKRYRHQSNDCHILTMREIIKNYESR